ncbi:type ISP restriction/modification enzyme [Chrysiogenes arsenatis]|uniref:type ISP restriction/modification enzyme n=1 Tax=Chrysiogenes arsenatis TaxID=309797 RepID=UPI001F01B7B7|nr:type ISP restriction/modification enzyme [Chrysiogenes arsenatis]
MIQKRLRAGKTTEHTFRGDLEQLLRTLLPDVHVTNEPGRVQNIGNPDYILSRKTIPIGYIEAKVIGIKLDGKNEQFERYKKGFDNLIITDYLIFRFYRYGQFTEEVRLAELQGTTIIANTDAFQQFENQIKDFGIFVGQTIKSPNVLAKMMAAKARLLQNTIEYALTSQDDTYENNSLRDQLTAFQESLIHDIDEKQFADIYAQTIAYGMFAARLHDTTLENFSRHEAAELIPKSNPFLRNLFSYIAGTTIDERLITNVDNLADVFRATDVKSLLNNFGNSATAQNDPIIHFYETFLSEYDPKLRKARGVWYTPEPVVSFIVRAVDDILKSEFGIKDGIADNSKIAIKVEGVGTDKRGKPIMQEKEVHKVQILDPATGTGTFLAEIIKYIYKTRFANMKGMWSGYVENDLIPRLNGFELLMASYAMAHLKLDLLLQETGYVPNKSQRFRVFLTNSLEEHHPATGTLFARWISQEAQEADLVKRDTPVMVVLGNPPYSGESANKGEWIMSLMEDYKKEPGGAVKLNEKNPKWINDDYVKFIRYAQHFIEKKGEGIMAFINPHGFLDNPTFRGMRWSLLNTYDKIYVIDLHGNSNKKETAPDGSKDENVFDIQQGVSISIFIKKEKRKIGQLGKVYHFDVYGKRTHKYSFLSNNSNGRINYKLVSNISPSYSFILKDIARLNVYKSGFGLDELMPVSVVGYQSHRDSFAVAHCKHELIKRLADFVDDNIDEHELLSRYNINESSSWKLKEQRNKIGIHINYGQFVCKTTYRAFDDRFAIMHPAICDRPRKELILHVAGRENYCLLVSKQQATVGFRHCFITKLIANDCVISTSSREANQVFPLRLYGSDDLSTTTEGYNLNLTIVDNISQAIGLVFNVNDANGTCSMSPVNIIDYIYAVLHSPSYRTKYQEFLKTDFPRIPYPTDANMFWDLVQKGSELRQYHLLEHQEIDRFVTSYPVAGNNTITRKITKKDWELYDEAGGIGRIWINDEQYFDEVPLIAWEFFIGGYQPAQKWLKDRHGRTLSYDDVRHYQRIIVALNETHRIMGEIDDTWQL